MSAGVLFAASSVLSAVQSYQQGQQQAAMYEIQALQTQAEGERKALEYELRANETLRNLRKTLAANVARGFSGGVNGLEGSSKLIETISTKEAGRDLMFDIANAKNAILTANTQADIYNESASYAKRSGILDSAASLAMAGYGYKQLGGKSPFGTWGFNIG